MKKTKEIKLRMTETALKKLNRKVSMTDLSREEFLRRLIAGKEIRETPPIEYGKVLRELRRIGANINHLLIVAQTHEFCDEREIRKLTEAVEHLEARLIAAVIG